MKTVLERRRYDRQPVTLLAKCLMTRKGKLIQSAVWVKDVSEGGLRLEAEPLRSTSSAGFRAGDRMAIQDVFYDDQGPQVLTAKVRWARRDPGTGKWSLGVQLTNGSQLRHGQGAAFREFLQVVKAA